MHSIIAYSNANNSSDLNGIRLLQQQNLPNALTQAEITSQGFVTVVHSVDELKHLNKIEQHVVAKNGDKVIGYLLAMTAGSYAYLPVLEPMFEMFTQVSFCGKPISQFKYIVVGQVCVHRDYRSRGILDACYALYKQLYKNKYDIAVTEIAIDNVRSLRAHHRIGFNEVHRYKAPDGNNWSIVLWDWNEIDQVGSAELRKTW